MNSDEIIDVSKLDNRKILHVIDNENGYCSICNKFERPELIKKNYIKCGEIKTKSRTVEDEYENVGSGGDQKHDNEMNSNSKPKNKPYDTISHHSEFDQSIFMQNKKNNKVITNVLCDFFKGHKCCKTCAFCDSLYYVPIWCFVLLILFSTLLITSVIIASVFYNEVIRTDLKSYTGSCTNNSECDTSKGLYCRQQSASNVEYCNCPALSQTNMCDCASSSYYWNGIKCTSVYGYNEGPCSGNYSCTAGLICNRLTSKCTCASTTPLWNYLSKTCSYMYLGCYFECLNNTDGCDISGSAFVLNSNILPIDIDVCLLQCITYSARYAIMFYAQQYKCGCTQTYNKYAIQASDSSCTIPCNYYNPIGIGRCPGNDGFYSAFQIGE